MTASSAIALCRALWPAVTEAAAPTTFLEGWYLDAVEEAGSAYFGTSTQTAVAHLLAHHAYRIDPAGVLNSGGASPGSVQAVTTSRRSVTYGAPAGSSGSASKGDQILMTTRPGQEYLRLRGRQLDAAPTFIDPWA